MNRGIRRVIWAVLPTLIVGGLISASPELSRTSAGADTDPTVLSGQGGSFAQPLMSTLIEDDTAGLGPLNGAYEQTDSATSVQSFVGSGPGQFDADFAVTQRPLTAAESSQSKADGRSYAYVPFASTPVAVATLVPTATWAESNSDVITTSDFCQNMPLTTSLLGQIIGFDTAQPLINWDDPRITCSTTPGTTAGDFVITPWANLDPSMSNYAMMALLDSTPSSQANLAAGLGKYESLTSSTAPSELWPYALNTVPGGDQPLLGKMIGISALTNAPGTAPGPWALGGIVPVSSIWTGAPLGTPWNLPTAAIQNAEGAFVPPSLSAATATASEATMVSTTDPSTDNLVTFNASTTDASAYNSLLMVEDYLVVPLNGLPADKATALAQFVRYVVGSAGQKAIQSFGSAPVTAQMQSADLGVAAQLDSEAVASANPNAVAGGSTTSATTSASTAAATGAADEGSGSSSSGGSVGGSASDGSSGGLAFTGTSHLGDWVGLGAVLLVVGAVLRRRLTGEVRR